MSKEIKFTGELDATAARAGGYVDYCPDPSKVYGIDIAALNQYCQNKGIDPLDLTVRERNTFIKKLNTAGVELSPLPVAGVEYNYRAASRYSMEKGVEPVDLTVREWQQFILN